MDAHDADGGDTANTQVGRRSEPSRQTQAGARPEGGNPAGTTDGRAVAIQMDELDGHGTAINNITDGDKNSKCSPQMTRRHVRAQSKPELSTSAYESTLAQDADEHAEPDADIKHDKNITGNADNDDNTDLLNDLEDTATAASKCRRLLDWHNHWHQSARTLLYLLLGDGLLAIPVVIDYVFFVTNRDTATSAFGFQSTANISGVAMMYWFLYLMVLWTVLILAQYIVRIGPKKLLRLVRRCVGRAEAERMRPCVEYLDQLYFYVSYVVMNIPAVTLWGVFFTGSGSATDVAWQTVIFRLIQCSLVLSIFLLIEKFLVQLISVGFHRTAYAERIVENKFGHYVVERLDEAKRVRLARMKAVKERRMRTLQQQTQQQRKFVGTSLFAGVSGGGGKARAQSPVVSWHKSLSDVVARGTGSPSSSTSTPPSDFVLSPTVQGVQLSTTVASPSMVHDEAISPLRERREDVTTPESEDITATEDTTSTRASPNIAGKDTLDDDIEMAPTSLSMLDDADTPTTPTNTSTHAPPSSHATSPSVDTPTPTTSFRARTRKAITQPFNFIHAIKDVTSIGGIMDMSKQHGDSNVMDETMRALMKRTRSKTDLNSIEDARKLAIDIFVALCKDGRTRLFVDDFYPAFPTKDEAQRAFAVFDRSECGDISGTVMRDVMVDIFRERSTIQRGMRDFSATVGKLDRILMLLFGVIVTLICLGIFNISVSSYLVTATSIVVSLSFIIGSSAKGLFESIVFLFFVHPFDVGDKIEFEGAVYRVRSMNLNSTVLRRLDGQEMYVSNTILMLKPVFNLRRSPHQTETLTLNASIFTPREKLQELEEELRAYVANHSRDFHPQLSLFIDEIQTPRDAEFQGMLRIRLCVHYRGNFHDGEARIRRRTGFLLAVKEAVLKLGIYAKVEVGAGSSTSVPSPPMLVSEAP